MQGIANTGERILLEKETPLMIARHFCAYQFAKDYVSGKNVLDIGCGEGYGSNFLAEAAREVTGIDYDKEVVRYACDKYQRNNLKFAVMDVRDLGSMTQKFDVISSFQNIEHIRDTGKLLEDIANLLKEGGMFICSTCNMKDASAGRNTPFNKFHVKEYLVSEFEQLLKSRFKTVEIRGLKRGLALKIFLRLKKIGLCNLLPEKLDPVKAFFKRANHRYFFWTKKDPDSALDFIAIGKS